MGMSEKKRNWFLFVILLVIGLSWGVVYWFLVVL